VKDRPQQAKPVTVPAGATQAGEVRARWAWTEAAVWTDRMLTALESGVKGDVWFSLIDKVHALRALEAAWHRVSANEGAAGVDHVTIAMFEKDLEKNLSDLGAQLRTGTYRPQAVRRVYIPKAGGGERPLGIPTVRDRVVQTALRQVMEPIFERQFAAESYGFRPGRGCKDALRRVDELLKAGYRHVVDADLKSYFDTIPHQKLMERVRERVADGRVLALVELFLTQGVMEEMSQWTPESGTPQGAVISPLLSNIYLDPLDRLMAGGPGVMVRYADDFVILCRSEREAAEALDRVRQWTVRAGLTLHPEKTRVVDAEREAFEFLGYRFDRGQRWPRAKSLQKLKDSVRVLTRRSNGHSLEHLIEQLNPRLRGWFGYFKHSHRYTFSRLDGWIRMRLRSILRKRQGKAGRGRGSDHQRWPNRHFAEAGLYSLECAHAWIRQSARR
jgi:RNA-directed DNA polymerase